MGARPTMTPRESFPLSWPDHWPRTANIAIQRSNFSHRGEWVSMARACDLLYGELGRLGASAIVVSTNMRTRLDGAPLAGQGQPADKGVAVYFKFKNRETVLACDKWHRVEDNLYAVGKHVEALRGQHRWGVGSLDQAFRGYQALPERGTGLIWWEVLGVPINASEDQIRNAYHGKAKTVHPDAGGNREDWERVNDAYRQACAHHEDRRPHL